MNHTGFLRGRSQPVIAMLVIVVCSVTLGFSSSAYGVDHSSTTSKTTTSSGSPNNALANSLKVTSIPRDLTPPLNLFTSQSTAWPATARSLVDTCDALSHPILQNAPKPCLLGDPNGTKTIVLAGDSIAAGWAPALNRGLRSSGYRLAVFPFSGCPMADMNFTGFIDGKPASHCDTWHKNVSSAIMSLHPDAVILSSVANIPGVDLTSARWSAGIKKFFDSVSTSPHKPTRILIGLSPEMVGNMPACLSVHSNPQDCSVNGRYWRLFQENEMVRDRTNARIAGARLIPAVQWLCATKGCSPVIGKYLVYADSAHLTMAYSLSIATQVTSAVLGTINSGQSSTPAS